MLAEKESLRAQQAGEVEVLAREQRAARDAGRARFTAALAQERSARAAARATGLAAFLGRVTGVTAIIDAVHRRRDMQRYRTFREEQAVLAGEQRAATLHLQRRHELQMIEVVRKLNALARVDARELRALDEKSLRARRAAQRDGHDHMPSLTLDLRPRGRGASVRKAKNRYQDSLRTPEDRQARPSPEKDPLDLRRAMDEALAAEAPIRTPVDLKADFARATGGETEGGGDDGEAGGLPDKPVSRASRSSERGRDRGRGRDDDFERER